MYLWHASGNPISAMPYLSVKYFFLAAAVWWAFLSWYDCFLIYHSNKVQCHTQMLALSYHNAPLFWWCCTVVSDWSPAWVLCFPSAQTVSYISLSSFGWLYCSPSHCVHMLGDDSCWWSSWWFLCSIHHWILYEEVQGLDTHILTVRLNACIFTASHRQSAFSVLNFRCILWSTGWHVNRGGSTLSLGGGGRKGDTSWPHFNSQ